MKATLLILPVLLTTALFAQGPPDGMGGGRGPEGRGGGMRRQHGRGMGMRGRGMGHREPELGQLLSDPNVRQQLGVTADQAAKIRQQESDFRKAEIRNNADLQVKRMDLNDLLAAEKPDRAAIDSKLQEIGAAQLAVEKSVIDNRLNMRDALTPAQRQKLQQMMAQPRQPPPAPNAAPRGPQGAGRGGRGAVPPPPPNPQAPRPPNQ
ncbi:MAG: periplasmic heavy metal sensor [Bryobacteraceae bacterium]